MLVGNVGASLRNNAVAQNRNSKQNKNVAFKGIVAEVAKDSYDVKVEANVRQFFDFMKKLTRKAMAGSQEANERLTGLIGQQSATALVRNPGVFTAKADASTKLIPLSGLGTRGEAIRNQVTSSLGQSPTHKAVMPLPAVLGEHEGQPVYLNTVTNEFLHMMEAGVMSPFEKLDVIHSEGSDGDLAVVVKGLEKGIIPKNKPGILTYTDDIGNHGARDYSNLMEKYKSQSGDSPIKAIAVGFEETKEEAAGKLGTFLQDGENFKVHEKPSIEVLDEHLPGDQKVLTNIGKIMFTPRGLQDIHSRMALNPDSLMKNDKGVPKYHVTEGMLKPSGEEGALDVIPKRGHFSDVGNGTVFTDKMLEIAQGKMEHIFPEVLESQIRKNVVEAADGKSATLDYGVAKVTLPTSKA